MPTAATPAGAGGRRRWVGRALALSASGALAACGFRPRGSGVPSTVADRVFVDADRGLSLLPELRDALRERGFTLAANRDEADLLLRAGGERVAERILSVQRTGRVSEYELVHEVNLLVARGVDGAPPVYPPDAVPNRVTVTRDYTYDVTEVLGKENEARILRRELRRELVRQVVLRTLATLVAEPVAASADGLHGTTAIGRQPGSSGSAEAKAREV